MKKKSLIVNSFDDNEIKKKFLFGNTHDLRYYDFLSNLASRHITPADPKLFEQYIITNKSLYNNLDPQKGREDMSSIERHHHYEYDEFTLQKSGDAVSLPAEIYTIYFTKPSKQFIKEVIDNNYCFDKNYATYYTSDQYHISDELVIALVGMLITNNDDERVQQIDVFVGLFADTMQALCDDSDPLQLKSFVEMEQLQDFFLTEQQRNILNIIRDLVNTTIKIHKRIPLSSYTKKYFQSQLQNSYHAIEEFITYIQQYPQELSKFSYDSLGQQSELIWKYYRLLCREWYFLIEESCHSGIFEMEKIHSCLSNLLQYDYILQEIEYILRNNNNTE